MHELKEGEVLEFERSAYHIMEPLNVEWPCLSFDFVKDDLGILRTKFPHTLYLAAGTQAERGDQNKVMLIKVSNLHKMEGEDSQEEDSDSEGLSMKEPRVEEQYLKHEGGVNRLRSMPQKPSILSTFSDTSKVFIFDSSSHLKALQKSSPKPNNSTSEGGEGSGEGSGGLEGLACGGENVFGSSKKRKGNKNLNNTKPVQVFEGHKSEGYGLDWSGTVGGRMVSGDCKGGIHLWEGASSSSLSSWNVESAPYLGHQGSVEDLQWSPTEPNGFASCSVDKTVKVWDTRNKNQSIASINAHNSDVNVISWHSTIPYLLLSGSDEGDFKVWDMRSWKKEHYAKFAFHKKPITSIEWSKFDENLFVVSSSDNSISIWDMSLYEDEEEKKEEKEEEGKEKEGGGSNQVSKPNVPHQLMFLHMGQNDIKEVHFHPQIPGLLVSTSLDGFNIWKPYNIEVEK